MPGSLSNCLKLFSQLTNGLNLFQLFFIEFSNNSLLIISDHDRGHSLSTYARRGRGVTQMRSNAYKGEGVDT